LFKFENLLAKNRSQKENIASRRVKIRFKSRFAKDESRACRKRINIIHTN
jgi:hypothetical protein